MYRRLPCDWFLTDGIHKKIRLDAPHTVEDALLEAGVIAREATCEQRQKDEWIFRRRWTYSASFSLNTEDARVFLHLTGLRGHYTVFLNGEAACEGDGEICEAEVTAFVQAENTIEIAFAPAGEGSLRPETGFGGAASYKLTGDAAITDISVKNEDGKTAVFTAIDSLTEGDAVLRYTLIRGGKSVCETAPEKLSAGYLPLRHTPFDALPAGEKCDLKAEILTDGTVSDDALISTFFCGLSVPARGISGTSEKMMGLGADAGATCAFVGGDAVSPQTVTLAARHALEVGALEDAALTEAPAALEPCEKLIAAAGGSAALRDNAFWLLTESNREVYTRFAAMLTEDDTDAVCALSRCSQAENLKITCILARVNGKSVAVTGADASRMSATSSALMDLDGTLRPAYYALMSAWQGDCACTVSPKVIGEDGIFSAAVYCVSDEHPGESASVTVTAYDLDGTELSRSSFAVTRGMGEAGRVTAELPESGVMILRTVLTAGEETLSASDEVVLAKNVKYDGIEKTQLLTANGKVTNVGSAAALYVTVPGARYFGCLLPGEYVTADSGDPDAAEGINIYI